jgi:sortase A
MPDILFTTRRASSHPRGGGRERGRGRGGRGARRALRALSWLLIAVGVLALAEVAVTLVWQEPFSALYARIEQDRLGGALRKIEGAPPSPFERHTLALLPAERQRVAFLARELEGHAAAGGPVGRIEIPSIGVSFVVVKGTGESELKKGPGIYSKALYPGSRFPGIPGTTAIAGHRTTYLEPFRHIDALHRGEHIQLDMPYARFTYTVTGQRVVAPTDIAAAIDPVGYSRVVLSACTPLFSAEKRLLVFARLTRTVPRGAALRAVSHGAAPFTSGARTPPGSALGRPLTAPLPGERMGSPARPSRST